MAGGLTKILRRALHEAEWRNAAVVYGPDGEARHVPTPQWGRPPSSDLDRPSAGSDDLDELGRYLDEVHGPGAYRRGLPEPADYDTPTGFEPDARSPGILDRLRQRTSDWTPGTYLAAAYGGSLLGAAGAGAAYSIYHNIWAESHKDDPDPHVRAEAQKIISDRLDAMRPPRRP